MPKELIYECLQVMLIVGGVPLLCSACIGLFVSVLQAATQVQDQSTPYLIKITVLLVVLWILGNYFWFKLVVLLQIILSSLHTL